jgi:gluconolactonase
MFAAPKVIETEIFAELPAEFRMSRRSAWADAAWRGRQLDSFLEGPCFDSHGNLFLVDIPFGRVFSVSPNGRFSLVAEYDGQPNGLKICDDGRAFIADYKNGIVALDLKSGSVSLVVSRRNGERFKGVNDLCFAPNGDLYFTDQGQTGLQDSSGCVYRLSANGRLDLILNNVPSPNGLVLDLDETTLFVAATRANAVWRVPLTEQGTVTKVGIFVQLSGGVGPDGLAMDEDGGLMVAHAGLGTVWHFDRLGQPLHRLRSAAGLFTTNLTFGGQDRRTLYITESEKGVVLKAETPSVGVRLHRRSEIRATPT